MNPGSDSWVALMVIVGVVAMSLAVTLGYLLVRYRKLPPESRRRDR